MWLSTILQIHSLASAIKEFKAEERKSLSKLFARTSELLEVIAIEFKNDNYPIFFIAALETLSESVTVNLTRIAKRNRIEDVIEAYKPFLSLSEEWEKRHEEGVTDNLLRIAGELRGLAILFKI